MFRRRRGLPPKDEAAPSGFTDVKPDPSQVGGVAEAPFVRLPDPATLFLARARRLLHLSEGHVLGDYLRFLATVVSVQADAVAALPAPTPVPDDAAKLRAGNGFPPISAEQVRSPDFAATLQWLLDHLDLGRAPEAAWDAANAVRAMSERERFALAAHVLEGAAPLDRLGEALFVAAALQVHLSCLAAQLDGTALSPVAEGVCPACGGAPVSSLVVGWSPASKARYLACSLCATLWNHVRIKCIACGSTEGIAYYALEDADAPEAEQAPELPADVGADDPRREYEGAAQTPREAASKTVAVETCTKCRSYVKHMQQHQEVRIDPLADDVASYALDLLAREEDFRRAGLNPLFLTG